MGASAAITGVSAPANWATNWPIIPNRGDAAVSSCPNAAPSGATAGAMADSPADSPSTTDCRPGPIASMNPAMAGATVPPIMPANWVRIGRMVATAALMEEKNDVNVLMPCAEFTHSAVAVIIWPMVPRNGCPAAFIAANTPDTMEPTCCKTPHSCWALPTASWKNVCSEPSWNAATTFPDQVSATCASFCASESRMGAAAPPIATSALPTSANANDNAEPAEAPASSIVCIADSPGPCDTKSTRPDAAVPISAARPVIACRSGSMSAPRLPRLEKFDQNNS